MDNQQPHDYYPNLSLAELHEQLQCHQVTVWQISETIASRSLFETRSSTTLVGSSHEHLDYQSVTTHVPSSSSSITTLEQSGRTSAHSDAEGFNDTVSFESSGGPHSHSVHTFGVGTSHEGTDVNTKSTTGSSDDQASHDPSQLTPRAFQLRGRTIATTTTRAKASGTHPKKGKWFCTYCREYGELKPFGQKHDWKKHEHDFHETGAQFHCRAPGCVKVFECEQFVKKHFKDAHRGLAVQFARIPLPDKQIWACGFTNCRKFCQDWESRCKDVSSCMLEEGSRWSYTRKILNMLKHSRVADTWKEVRNYWYDRGIYVNQLQWDPETTRNLRIQLECLDFGDEHDLRFFLERLFKAGLPKEHSERSGQFPLSQTQTDASYSPVKASDATNTSFQQATQFGPLLPHFHQPQQIPFSQSFDMYASNAYTPQPTQYRNSVVMTDDSQVLPQTLPANQDYVPAEQDRISLQEFLNTTPPLTEPYMECSGETIQSPTEISPAKSNERRNRSWTLFHGRKSQQLQQPIVTNHPDLGPNFRLPQHPVPTRF
ncbi:hypothetical protein BCR34DRAFT_327153 [Clohesyomyces aquaticus]|uniref:C2H2-type domain-containing protein n=1 Tax=Clohesyomyces aquaticus TaxID=1231657 RepID=A0A1Y1ZN97_9PLEO|nr:hypothetical protein BCR34DRAFT_327153 [Clohesyomyces aquaticus]